MLLEKTLHLGRRTPVIAESEAGKSYNNKHF